MATNFPTSLDALTNPSSGQTLNSPSHSAQHANSNDAIEALQTKVGVNSSAVTTSHDYKIRIYNPIGEITMWATSTAPTGWLIADGSAISRSTYSDLWGVLGTSYGAGDGSTTFNLPNLKGRVPVGRDAGQTEFSDMGETGGSKTHTLTSAEMPSHTHIQDAHTHTQDAHMHKVSDNKTLVNSGTQFPTVNYNGTGEASNTASTTAVNQNTTATNQNTGGGTAHNNLQPYIALNYIIRF